MRGRPAQNTAAPPTPTRRAVGLLLLAALALGLAPSSGCASASRQNPRESLPESLRDFHNQLVWGRYAEAAGYLPEGQRAHFIGTYDELDDEMRFVEYELGSVDVDGEEAQATVMVTLSWYRIPHYVVHETRVRETWTLDEENDFWWLIRREDPEAAPGEPEASALND